MTDPVEQRDRLADRLQAANVSVKRFNDVHDEAKGTTDHTQREPDSPDLSGNYGVYAGPGADSGGDDGDDAPQLVDVDVDDYGGDAATEGLDSLPSTFTVESPHTNGEENGHRYYGVIGDIAEAFEDRFGVKNPAPEWGEVRVHNQYTVGPGSQISPGGCDKEWCDSCDGCGKEWCDDCADDDKGYYRIAADRPVAVLDAEGFVERLARDLDTDDEQDGENADMGDYADANVDVPTQSDPSDVSGRQFAVDTVLDYALERDDKLRNLWNGRYRAAGFPDDRSKAESSLAQKLGWWFQGEKSTVSDLMDRADTEKWGDRGSDYRDSVLEAVDENSDYFDATTSDGSEVVEREDSEAGGSSGDDGHELPTPDLGAGFEVIGGGYGTEWYDDDAEKMRRDQWTNFQIEVDSFLVMADDGSEEIALTVHPRDGDSYEVEVEPTAFNEKRDFKREVACGRTTTFTGGEDELAKIKQFVGTQDAPEQRGVRLMGRHDDPNSMIVPGGSLTTDGWADDADTRYVERSLGIERKVGLSPDADPIPDAELDADRDSEVFGEVANVLELLPETRDPERFLPVIGWFYAAPLRPLITDMAGEFPVLSITGGTGAGKTSTLETMWSLLGVEGDPFSANDTSFTAMTTISATDTLPVWFDEYKPTDMSPGRLDGFHDNIRKSTRGGVVSKGNPDQSTTEYHLRAPVVVSGEQRFAGPAEQRRSVLTTFRETTTDPDSEEARAFAALTGGSFQEGDNEITHFEGYDPPDHAHVYHRWLLAYDAEDVRESWRTAEERVLQILDDYGIGGVDSAGRTALQTIIMGLSIYRSFAHDMGASVPFDAADRDRALTYVAKQQGNDGRRESHLDEFVRLMSLAAMENELEEDTHYTRKYDRDTGSEIRINPSRAYPKVSQYVRNHGLDDTTELLDEGDYRQRFREGVEDPESYVTAYSKKTRPVGRCVGIDAQRANNVVEGFDDDHFYGREEQGENGQYPSDE